MNKHFIWDNYSDQPHIIKDRTFKKEARKRYIRDYIKMMLLSFFILPFATLIMIFLQKKTKTDSNDFFGLGVNLDKGDTQPELIDELGVKNLLIRLPLSNIKNLQKYYDFAKSFGDDKKIVLNILQDRANIEDLELLKYNLELIFKKFDGFVSEYQIGNAINRLKWEFFSVSEYLDFYSVAYKLKDSYPNIKLLGSSVIDFEYYYTVSTLFNRKNIQYDAVSSLLYVDRRGSPKNTQYGIFDFKNKINLLYALVKLSPKTNDEIYITETNWPRSNTAPYAPTSELECVSDNEYVKYMKEYHDIALKSGKIKRVYWHQLIAPGYGLVDNRNGTIVKLPQFYAYKEMVQNAKK